MSRIARIIALGLPHRARQSRYRLYKDWLAESRRCFGVARFGNLQSRVDTAFFLRPNARSGSN
jgi:hypothetical protein